MERGLLITERLLARHKNPRQENGDNRTGVGEEDKLVLSDSLIESRELKKGPQRRSKRPRSKKKKKKGGQAKRVKQGVDIEAVLFPKTGRFF